MGLLGSDGQNSVAAPRLGAGGAYCAGEAKALFVFGRRGSEGYRPSAGLWPSSTMDPYSRGRPPVGLQARL